MLLANHGALTVGSDVFAAYFKMETIEHFAKISLVARLLGGENLIAGRGGAPAGAPRRLWHSGAGPDLLRFRPLVDVVSGSDPATCQIVEAPAGGGLRLVPEGRTACRRAPQPRTGTTRKFG